jgi:hypothetical protein
VTDTPVLGESLGVSDAPRVGERVRREKIIYYDNYISI